jgi:hypothetical protein
MQIQLAPFQCKITMTHRNPFLHPFLAHCVVTRARIAAKSRRSRNSLDQWSPVPFLPFLFHMQWIQPKHNVMILTSASSSPLFKFKKELQQIVEPLFQIPLALTWCFPHVFFVAFSRNLNWHNWIAQTLVASVLLAKHLPDKSWKHQTAPISKIQVVQEMIGYPTSVWVAQGHSNDPNEAQCGL